MTGARLDGGLSLATSSEALASVLRPLQQGIRRGFSDPGAFIASIEQQRPVIHQLVMARRFSGNAPNDRIEEIYDRLEAEQFPARETLDLRASWRYQFEGTHRLRYRVVHLKDGQLEELHAGETREFTLDDAEASFVHRAQIEVEFPAPGHYAVALETDGELSSFYPIHLRDASADASPPPAAWPFEAQPLLHAMMISAVVRYEPAASKKPKDEVDAQRFISIEGTFNEFRPHAFPATLSFDSWVRWGQAFEGEHTYQLLLVDERGAVVAQAAEQSFKLVDDHQSFQTTSHWEVSFKHPGRYFVLCMTDGQITRAMPLRVRAE